MTNQTGIPYMCIRGGSSKGIYFYSQDLPEETSLRDEVLKWVMGAYGDPRQIDGLGGADPLTSKIALVCRSKRPDSDVDYTFIQAIVGKDALDATPNCGNLLAGVGAFALETGLLDHEIINIKNEGITDRKEAQVRVFLTNSGSRCLLKFPIKNGLPVYEGSCHIDGVIGTAAPVMCYYHDIAGSICGSLLPTKNLQNTYEGITVTCVDNGMPLVALRAADFALTGEESPAELNQNQDLKKKLEAIRIQAGQDMGLGDVTEKTVPKMCLISPPTGNNANKANMISFSTRTFIPHRCHEAIGVLGAVSAASAVVLKGSAVHDLAHIPLGENKSMTIAHPSGSFTVNLELKDGKIENAGLLRTTRVLARGEVYIPSSVWSGKSGKSSVVI